MKRSLFAASIALIAAMNGCEKRSIGDAMREFRGRDFEQIAETPNHRLEFRLIPEPLYYLGFGEFDTASRFKANIIDSLKAVHGDSYGVMFTLTISPRMDTLAPTDFSNDVVYGNHTGEFDYRNVHAGFQSGLESKIWLETENARYDLRTFHFTNSWGLSKSRTITLVFGSPREIKPSANGKIHLVSENLVPGHGRTRFTWNLASCHSRTVKG